MDLCYIWQKGCLSSTTLNYPTLGIGRIGAVSFPLFRYLAEQRPAVSLEGPIYAARKNVNVGY